MSSTKAKLSNEKILDSKSPMKKKAITALFRRVIKGPQLQVSAVKDRTVPSEEEKRKIAEHSLHSDIGDYAPPTKKRRMAHQPKVIEPNKTSVLEIMKLLDLADADEQKKKKIGKMKEAAQEERRRKVAENYRNQMFIAQREAMIEVDQFFQDIGEYVPPTKTR
ncbi:GSCOCG00009838001-RA-CDS, partial [Cotesia congregata]